MKLMLVMTLLMFGCNPSPHSLRERDEKIKQCVKDCAPRKASWNNLFASCGCIDKGPILDDQKLERE